MDKSKYLIGSGIKLSRRSVVKPAIQMVYNDKQVVKYMTHHGIELCSTHVTFIS